MIPQLMRVDFFARANNKGLIPFRKSSDSRGYSTCEFTASIAEKGIIMKLLLSTLMIASLSFGLGAAANADWSEGRSHKHDHDSAVEKRDHERKRIKDHRSDYRGKRYSDRHLDKHSNSYYSDQKHRGHKHYKKHKRRHERYSNYRNEHRGHKHSRRHNRRDYYSHNHRYCNHGSSYYNAWRAYKHDYARRHHL